MAELNRSDIISDDALMAPLVLNKNFETLLSTILDLKKEMGGNAAFAQSATNITGVGTAIEQLVTNEKELVKVQNQLASAVAKDTDEYAKLKKKVDEANASARTRVALGEKDALTINRTNASMKELQAALTRNRQAYANLTNEQARNSAEGKKLLATIQSQDKQFKELSGTIGQHQVHVGDYKNQLSKADEAAQAIAPSLHGMAKAIQAGTRAALAFIATPLGLTLAAIALLLIPIIKYFRETGEGQDVMARKTAELNALLTIFNDKIIEIGKALLGFPSDLEDNGLVKFFKIVVDNTPNIVSLSRLLYKLIPDETRAQLEETARLAGDLADALDNIKDSEENYGIQAARTENEVKRLMLQAKNRTLSEVERIKLIDKAFQLESELVLQRTRFAEDEFSVLVEANRERLKGVGIVQQADETQQSFIENNIDGIRNFKEELATSFIESIKKIEEAQSSSIAIEEKLMNQRDLLLDKQRENETKAEADRQKALEEELDILRKAYDIKIQTANEAYKKDKELREKEEAELQSSFNKMAGFLKKRSDSEQAAYEKRKLLQQKEREQTIIFLENTLYAYQEFSNAILNLSFSVAEGRIQDIDKQIADLDKKTEEQIKNAGDNDAAIAQIEANAEARREQLEAKRLAERQRQARLEKGAALIEAAIRTSLAVLNQLAAPPALTAIPRSIAAGILGAIQVAAIAAKPIPQFAVGTDNAPEGLALVGERGAELKVEPSGKMSLTPSVPTLDYLKAGTQIIPHKETMQALALAGLGSDVLRQREQEQQVELAKSLKQIEKNTRKLGKSSTGNLFKQGILTYEQKIKEDKSKQYIRRSNLGY